MGLLDSVIGAMGAPSSPGGGGADLLGAVVAMLGQQGGSGGLAGGLGALVEQFSRGGLGDVAKSWVGTGANLPVSPDQVAQVLGPDTLGRLAQQLGLGQGEVAGQLSQVLPQVVDRLTPNGQLPAPGTELGGLADIGGLLGGLLRR